MDKNEALEILGLSPRPYRDEVKAALRALAKEHHPDFWAHDPDLARRQEEKMKQINVAYGVIQPMLHRFPVRPSESLFWVPFLKYVGGLFTGLIRWRRNMDGPEEKNPAPVSRPSRSTVEKTFVKKPKPPRKAPAFQDILDPLYSEGEKGHGRRKQRGKKTSAWENYSRHMELKKRVKNRRRVGEDRGPVGPVTRVKRVSPLSRD